MKTNENQSLEVLRASNEKYEYLVAEICYEGEPIIRINQENGEDALEAEILIEHNEPEFKVQMLFKDLVKALQLAKKRLSDSCQKENLVTCSTEILLLNDKDRSFLTSIIQYQEHTVAQISQDKGIDNLEIELFLTSSMPNITFKFPVNELSCILEKAKNKLVESSNQGFMKF